MKYSSMTYCIFTVTFFKYQVGYYRDVAHAHMKSIDL